MSVKPISRSQLGDTPDFWPETIEAFNELIAENWTGSSSTFKQNDIVSRIITKLKANNSIPSVDEPGWISLKRSEIFDKHQLDVENLYRKQGFKVEYDKPGCNETYEPIFKFK